MATIVVVGAPHHRGQMATIGERLAYWRERRGLSQRGLGRLAGISGQHVNQIEHGLTSPTVDVARKLADALDVSLAELLDVAPDLPLRWEDVPPDLQRSFRQMMGLPPEDRAQIQKHLQAVIARRRLEELERDQGGAAS